MKQLAEVKERTTAYLSVTFLNKAKVPTAPSTVSYSVHDSGSKTEIRGTTLVAPGETVEIVLAPSDNVILDPSHEYENRIVTVDATYGMGDESHDHYMYTVRNLLAVIS